MLTGSVLKFGGTSVGSIEHINRIAAEIARRKHNGEKLIVVVSAMGKSTDHLLSLAGEISGTPNKRDLDMLLATGEQQTISLLSMSLNNRGCRAVSFTGFQAGIKTKGNFTRNRIAEIDRTPILKALEEDNVVVVAGFQGMNEHGDITTLGRGGSDTSAVALAARFNFSCEIYTDVEGVYACDPRILKEAAKLNSISYEEMIEMSSLGAGVMESRAVELGRKYGIPIYLAKNTFDTGGTWIRKENTLEQKVVTGMSIDPDEIMISVSNIENTPENVAAVFRGFGAKDIDIDMISQTVLGNNRISVSFSCKNRDRLVIENILAALQEQLPETTYVVNDSICKVSIVGIGMRNQSGVASSVFDLFAVNGIRFYQVTTSEISISYMIDNSYYKKAVKLLAETFNLESEAVHA